MTKKEDRPQYFEEGKEFWNARPCDGQNFFAERRRFRYAKDPWIPALLERIAQQHSNVVEVGCGQGTDGITLCAMLPEGGSYTGFDLSTESIASANNATSDAPKMAVTPEFKVGNAEKLDLPGDSVECVYSLGVLHHSPSTVRAVREVYRVIKPGGSAHILLYNRWSPRVLIAHLFRGFQGLLDRIFGTRRCLYNLLKGRHAEGILGTALLECFGVPVLRSYSIDAMEELFTDFEIKEMRGIGDNFSYFWKSSNKDIPKPFFFGVFWYVHVEKQAQSGSD